jgi:transaldolase
MTICIDSAAYADATHARQLGWVKGVTTNPILLAQTGKPAKQILNELATLDFEQVFYQLIAPTLDEMKAEMELASRIVGDSLVLKIPPTEAGFRFVAEHSGGRRFCITAVYSPVQAAVAAEAGADFVAVYVNRATHLLGDGPALVNQIAGVLRGAKTRILAASLKSAEEAGAALAAGAHDLTIPAPLIFNLTHHPMSAETVAQFNRDGIGLTY